MLRIELRDEAGNVLAVTGEDEGEIGALLPEPDPGEFPLLSSIDRYGDTIFNSIQMERLVLEIDAIRDVCTPRQAILLESIAGFCRQGLSRPHRYLWFLGD
jgi:hypothetical protein